MAAKLFVDDIDAVAEEGQARNPVVKISIRYEMKISPKKTTLQ